MEETTIDRYEVVSELGRGGMGVVYKARDPRLNREVAVKMVPPALLTPESEQRFVNEAQLVAQMDHPSIVPIHDFGHHEESLFFVMPLVPGTSLRDNMREGSLVLRDVLDIGIQVAEALDYSHSRGVTHRDIKPENIMISREEGGAIRARVMDFGLAFATNVTRMTRTGMLVGTMAYVSPEQVTGKSIDHRSDIYALGTVLYECVTNDVPFTGELQSVLYRIVHEIPQAPRERGAEIDEELESLILGCLAKEPDKRFQKVSEVAQGLKTYRSGLRESQQIQAVVHTRTMAVPRPAGSPFAGREKELAELQQRLNRATEGKSQFVVVSGEAGVGKTRLVEELENLASARQIRVLRGRSVGQAGAFPYFGFCDMIQDYFQQKELGSASSGVPDLSDVACDLIALFPMLGEIETIRSATGGSAEMDRKAESHAPEDRTQIFELLSRTLTRLAGGKPLVLVMEELHAAKVSIEALQYILRRLGATPTLVLGTYRSTEIDKRHPLSKMLTELRGDPQFASIALGPFPPEEHRSFLATLVGGSEVNEKVAKQIYEASEGNPFFTKELVRSLLDSGSLLRDDTGAWALPGGLEISSDSMPATIQQAVEERIGRLPDELRTVLSIASVIGRTFDFRDLETLAPDADNLDDAMDRLVQEGFIEEDRRSRGDRMVFSSGVVRDVLYAELSRRKRRSLHRKYAKQLEKRHSGRPERVYPQLLFHFAEGDVADKAVEYGLLQAKRSLQAFSPEETVRSAKTALEFLDTDWEGDPSLEGEARLLLSTGHDVAGDTLAALREIEKAIAVFERENLTDRTLAALLAATKTAWHARRTQETARWLQQGIRQARAAEDNDSLVEFLSLAATVANLRGEYEKANEYLREVEQLGGAAATGEATEPARGILQIPMTASVDSIDPARTDSFELCEVVPCIYESLTRIEGEARIVPWLAAEFSREEGGKKYRFRLRDDVLFHDGSKLTTKDVRYSFERLLGNQASTTRSLYSSILGSKRIIEGKASELAGFHVHSDSEFTIELEEPVAFFPVLISHPCVAILREGTGQLCGSSAEDSVGTGPFRVSRFDRGERLELERNPDYWRPGFPRCQQLMFNFGVSSEEILSGFRSGKFSMAADLPPAEVETLRRDGSLGAGYRETPSLTTYYAIFNTRRGVLSNKELRKRIVRMVDVGGIVRQTLGQSALPADGLIPPALLGHDPLRDSDFSPALAKEPDALSSVIELTAAVHPVYSGEYSNVGREIARAFYKAGLTLRPVAETMEEFMAAAKEASVDVLVGRWGADYPDADTFANLLHSSRGWLGPFCGTPEIDQLIDNGRTEADPETRHAVYRRFEETVAREACMLFLFHEQTYRFARPDVEGLSLSYHSPAVAYERLTIRDR